MPTASKSTMPAAAKPTTHAPASATTHAAAPETAMHTSAEAGLAAEGVLGYHAAVVESAECAGVAARLHVRRGEATIGSMVEVASEIVATSEIVVMVEKGMAP
jgi:hypothetical protein